MSAAMSPGMGAGMGTVRRLPVDEELLLEDELVVLVGQRVVLLSPLASSALQALTTDWSEIADLERRLVEEYGDPGDEAALAGVLDALAAEGLLEVGR